MYSTLVTKNLEDKVSDEYSFLAEHRRRIWVKAILPFAFTYDLLASYGIIKLRDSRHWDFPSKWFEETIKNATN